MTAPRIEGESQNAEENKAAAGACYGGQEFCTGPARTPPGRRDLCERGLQGSLDFNAAQKDMTGNRIDETVPYLHHQAIVETMTEGSLILSSHGTIVYCNSAFTRMVDMPPEQLAGLPFSCLVAEEGRALFHDMLEEGNKTGHAEIDLIHLAGKTGDIPVRLVENVRVADHDTAILCIVVTDLTRRMEAEDTLRQAMDRMKQMQKMEAIGTLAGGIAHDFNNILSAIIGFSEMSLEDLDEGHPAKHYAAQILRAATRGRDLVRQIMIFSHTSERERKHIKPSLIITEALKLIRASLPSTITIRERIEAESGVIFASSTQIHQVIMNLCTNAGHAMRAKGGILEVSLGRLDFDAADEAPCLGMAPGPYLKISVSDTGEGMTGDILSRIFEPFFTTKSQSEGTGMGLALVQEIVKSHSGVVTARSTPARGSVFDVYFPRVEVTSPDEAETAVNSRMGTGRILLVDDEDAIIEMGASLLRRLGYEVHATQDSLEALDIFRRDPSAFDLVITDQTMPRMTGTKLAQELTGLRKDIPIILCTGYSEIVNRNSAKELGIREFLTKPVLRSELAESIRRALGEREQACAPTWPVSS